MKTSEQKKSFTPNIYTLAIVLVICSTAIYLFQSMKGEKSQEVLADEAGVYLSQAPSDPNSLNGPAFESGSSDQERQTFYDEALRFQVPLDQTTEMRQAIKEQIISRGTFFLRDIYEEYFDQVGANGLITAVTDAYPVCHDRAHDLGKVIFANSGQIGESLRICSDACYSGCLHGVLMEAFSQEEVEPHEHTEEELINGHTHVSLEDVEEKMNEICSDDEVLAEYKRGDCLHGIGHALMYLSNYDVPEAMEYCDLFETGPERYYCATGAYMEYTTQKYLKDRAADKSLFYPCDENEYPAACFRYLFGFTFYEHYLNNRPTIDIIKQCLELDEYQELGCFHGIGNAHIGHIAYDKVSFDELCSFGTEDDQYMCIEGAIERMARYHPVEAEAACKQLSGWKYELCEKGRANELYSLDKSFDLYLP